MLDACSNKYTARIITDDGACMSPIITEQRSPSGNVLLFVLSSPRTRILSPLGVDRCLTDDRNYRENSDLASYSQRTVLRRAKRRQPSIVGIN